MGTEGSGKAEVGGDWEKREVRLMDVGYCESNQMIITNLMYSKQRGWVASMDNLTSINMSHSFNSHFSAPVSINNLAPQIILGHRQVK